MDLDCCYSHGKIFRYLKLIRMLIVPKKGKMIAVVNLDRKQVEILIKVNGNGAYIVISKYLEGLKAR